MKQEYTYTTAKKRLADNGCIIRVPVIYVDTFRTGIKLWGAVDYLCRKHEYWWADIGELRYGSV